MRPIYPREDFVGPYWIAVECKKLFSPCSSPGVADFTDFTLTSAARQTAWLLHHGADTSATALSDAEIAGGHRAPIL